MSLLVFQRDLKPDAQGNVSAEEVEAALLRIGISDEVASRATRANFAHRPAGGKLNLFQMKGDPNVEHRQSTGIRGGERPNREAFAELEKAGEMEKVSQPWTRFNFIDKAVEYFLTTRPVKNAAAEDGQLRSTMTDLWDEFSARDPATGEFTLSKKEMKALWMDSKYPSDFKARPAFRAKAVVAANEPMIEILVRP